MMTPKKETTISNLTKSFVLAIFCFFFLVNGKITAQSTEAPNTYVAYRAGKAPTIDGMAEESIWGSVPFSERFIDIEGEKIPKYGTKMKMMWDDNNLYIYAFMEEPHVWGNLKKRDTVIFYNNDFEVFIDPDGDTHNYYELEVNALNTQWDLFLTKPYRNGGMAIDSWDIQGLKTAVAISGTLNDSRDEDRGWSIEIAIPWEVITEAYSDIKPPVDKFWRINFSRVNWDFDLSEGKYFRKRDDNGKFLPEYNWVWSPQWVINMHEPEHWGYVYFSTGKPDSKFEFSVPKNEYVKWELYRIYRQLHKNMESDIPEQLMVLNNKIDLHLERSLYSWHIWCLSPFTKTKLIIAEDGRYFEKK